MGKAGMQKIAFVLRAREWPLGFSVGAKISRLEGNGRAAAVQKRGTFFSRVYVPSSPPSVVKIGLVSRRKRRRKDVNFPPSFSNPRFPR